jgi:uncharacterized protein
MTPEAAKTEGPEPTMEEILASIRRIISEDGAKVEAPPPPPDSVLDLTEMLEAEKTAAAEPSPAPAAAPAPPPLPEIPVAPEVVMEEAAPAPEPVAAPPPPPPAAPVAEAPPKAAAAPTVDEEALLSSAAAKATAAAMSALSTPRGSYAEGLSIGNGSRTLESIVLDLMRPILKEWLDRNLPPMVERIVQKEIRKITRDLG